VADTVLAFTPAFASGAASSASAAAPAPRESGPTVAQHSLVEPLHLRPLPPRRRANPGLPSHSMSRPGESGGSARARRPLSLDDRDAKRPRGPPQPGYAAGASRGFDGFPSHGGGLRGGGGGESRVRGGGGGLRGGTRERLFVLGNLAFRLSHAALGEELGKVGVRCECVVTVEGPASYANRPLNNGNAVVFLESDDARSADALTKLDRRDFCGRIVTVASVENLTICVKNAPEGVGDEYIRGLFENSAVADMRRVSKSDWAARDNPLWFVDFRGPQDFARALTDHLRDKVKALPAPPPRRDAFQSQANRDGNGDGMGAANPVKRGDGVVEEYCNGRDEGGRAGPLLPEPRNGGDLRHSLSNRGPANGGAGSRADRRDSYPLRDAPPVQDLDRSLDEGRGREPSRAMLDLPPRNSRVSPPPPRRSSPPPPPRRLSSPPPRRGVPDRLLENQGECPPGARGRFRAPLGLFRDGRDARRWELVRDSISAFLERDFDAARALHVRHLKFCELSDRDREARELALKRCVEDALGGVRVKSVTILGRKGTSAVVTFYDESSMQAVPADGMGIKFEDWPVDIGRFKRRMLFAMKGFHGDIERLRLCDRMCGPSSSTFEFATEVRGDSAIAVEGDGHGAVTLMAMDGLNGIACNVVADSSFGPDRGAGGRGFHGRDVVEGGSSGLDLPGREPRASSFRERDHSGRDFGERKYAERDMPSRDSQEYPRGPPESGFPGRSPLRRSGRDLSAGRGAGRHSDAPYRRATNGGAWKVFLENAPFGSTVLRYVKGQIGTSVWLDIQPGPQNGTFFLSGKRGEDLERILRLSGVPVQDPRFRGEAIIVSEVRNERREHLIDSPSRHDFRDTNSAAHRGDSRDLEQDRRLSHGGDSPRGRPYAPGVYLPHGPYGRDRIDACSRGAEFEYTEGRSRPEALDPPHRREAGSRFSRKPEPMIVRDQSRGLAGPSPALSRPGSSRPGSSRDGGALGARKTIAGTSAASRGFRASPVTQSPKCLYVSAVKKERKELPDVELPALRDRLYQLEADMGIYSILDGTSHGAFDDFLAAIPGAVQQEVINSVISIHDDDDVPQTSCVWSGLMVMQGAQRGSRSSTPNRPSSLGDQLLEHPAHCNGFLVVKSRQSDETVNAAIRLLPPDLNIEFRVGWDSQKHIELLHEDAVVFMVRSSREVEGDSDVDRTPSVVDDGAVVPLELSPIESQQALLGMLRNLQNKQRIGVCRYTYRETREKMVALCIPPSAHAFERLGVPWRFRDMVGHDTVLVVAGKSV
jgi:hypothetical protein